MRLHRELLPNGLTLLVQPLTGLASVSIGLVTRSGSRDETPGEAGLSHLAEHMLFQGTARRDTRELSRVISAVGGNLDAYTSRESTAYYTKVPAAHLGLAMDVLADMTAHSRFAAPLLEKEKGVILEEIRMYEDEPEELVHDLFSQALWPDHPLGRSITGSRSELLRVHRRALVDFVRRHYQPRRLILSVAGRVSLDEVRDLAWRYFGSLRNGGTGGGAGPSVPPSAALQVVQERKLEQVHVVLGAEGTRYADPRRLTALALSNVLGGGPNSRLFYEVRERRALTYAVYSFLDFYRDTGVIGIYFACGPRKLNETLRVVGEELFRLSRRPVSGRELRDLKEQMRGNLLLSLENSSNHMWRMVQHELYLRSHPGLRATLSEIDRLNADDLQRLAHDLFFTGPLSMAVVGPVGPRYLPQLDLFGQKLKKQENQRKNVKKTK